MQKFNEKMISPPAEVIFAFCEQKDTKFGDENAKFKISYKIAKDTDEKFLVNGEYRDIHDFSFRRRRGGAARPISRMPGSRPEVHADDRPDRG